MAQDLTHFLVAQLAAAGIETRGAEDNSPDFWAYCFNGHDERAPSLHIRKADGMFYCFGCGVKGPNWNALAKRIGGERLRDQDLPDSFGLLHQHLDRHWARLAVKAELPWGLEPWGPQHYRGLSPVFLRRLGAHRWYDEPKRCNRILFPIEQQGDLLGWVARRLDQNNEMKYRNAPGLKATEILYPADFVYRCFRPQTIVLVEGPLDALRLCHFRIPALAIMGTNNWRDRKRNLLANLGITRIVIATDGDLAGRRCRYEQLAPSLEPLFTVEHFLPPEDEDPGSMDRKYIDQLKAML